MVTEVRASHILVKTENDAKVILQRLQKGESFAKLAEEFPSLQSCKLEQFCFAKLASMDSSKCRGGDLGYFGRGRMVREFENAAFALENG